MWNKFWKKTGCHEWDSNARPPDYYLGMLPLHYRDNHAGNIAILRSVDVYVGFPGQFFFLG